MLAQFRPALVLLAALTVLTGGLYPLVVTAIAKGCFADQANGSLVLRDGKIVGSRLIGQPFDEPRLFWSRPSATTPACNGGASSGSNLGPLNPVLAAAVAARVAALEASDPGNEAPLPVDLVTTSASGLDPHITPAAAFWQVARVARERQLGFTALRELVERHVEGRTLGLLGEPRVNVLELNLALGELDSQRRAPSRD